MVTTSSCCCATVEIIKWIGHKIEVCTKFRYYSVIFFITVCKLGMVNGWEVDINC